MWRIVNVKQRESGRSYLQAGPWLEDEFEKPADLPVNPVHPVFSGRPLPDRFVQTRMTDEELERVNGHIVNDLPEEYRQENLRRLRAAAEGYGIYSPYIPLQVTEYIE